MNIKQVIVATPATGWLSFVAIDENLVVTSDVWLGSTKEQAIEIAKTARRLADVLSADLERYLITADILFELIDRDELAAIEDDDVFAEQILAITRVIEPDFVMARSAYSWPPPPYAPIESLYLSIGAFQEELESAGFCLTQDALTLFRAYLDDWLVGYESAQAYANNVLVAGFIESNRELLLRTEDQVRDTLHEPIVPRTRCGALGPPTEDAA